ncbi:hypothetical protein ACLOJK_039919 [Asimina triloba]
MISLSSPTLTHASTRGGKLILLQLNPPSAPKSNSTFAPLRSLSLTNSPIDSLLRPVRKLNLPKGVLAVAKRLCNAESETVERTADASEGVLRVQRSQRLLQKLGGGIRVNGTRSSTSELPRGGNSVTAAAALEKKLILVEIEAGGAKSVNVCLDESIIIGTGNRYALIFSSAGQGSLIFSLPESSGFPCLKSLWRERLAMLLVDNVGIIVNDLEQPVGGSSIFRHAPDLVGELGPHVIVVKDGMMDLYHKRTGSHVHCPISVVCRGRSCQVRRCAVVADESEVRNLVVVATPSKSIVWMGHNEAFVVLTVQSWPSCYCKHSEEGNMVVTHIEE